ncbi:MAG TPA: VIT domain-containing protein, partial [Polyangiaceae bacterium]|nr:VIT domain-containing protein [Polyangiaceae bacterium]
MEGSDEFGEASARALTAAIARDGARLFRFACALVGEEGAESVLERALIDACDASDESAFAGPRLFAAVRRRASQWLEQRRGAAAESRGAVALSDLRLSDARPTEREALLLRYVGGLSVADVAVAAGIDEAVARVRVSRGLAFVIRLGTDTPDEPSADVGAGRRMVEAALADTLDGAADDAVTRFVAEDDVSRDLVHDAGRVVAKLRAYEPARRLDATALEDRVAAACAAARAAVAAPSNESPAEHATTTAGASKPETHDGADAARDAAASAPARRESSRKRASDSDDAKRARRRRLSIVLGAVAVFGVFAAVVGRSGDSRDARAAWSGKLATVSRAFGGGAGVERCSPDRAVCGRIDRGDDVPAGSTLRTDGQTRAVVEMRDGTRLALDRDTELLLDGAYPRRARLDHGSLVADVPALGTSRARIDLPLGFVEAQSVKMSVVGDATRADVEVARGSLQRVGADERGVAVHAGEAGRLEPGSAPSVFESASLGARFGWTERAFTELGAKEANISGLGELGAKRPGDDHETKGLVSLASHSARVRIAGNVARTEIEEVFTSSSDDVLEGVFRFPLPPDAQIERLALEVDGNIEEGAFVDRDRAEAIWRGAIVNAGAKRRVGEEIVWVPGPWRDPALLEWQRGGRFELRVYPIPRRASRKVLLSYTQVVPEAGGIRRYVYPLPYDPAGSTRVGRFDLDVEIRGDDPRKAIVARGYSMRQSKLPDGARALTFGAERFSPSGDLTIEYSLPNAGAEVTAWAYRPGPDEVAGAKGGAGPSDAAAYVALALRPKLPRTFDGVERDFAIVVDSSRSMYGERFRRAAAIAESIVREMDRGDRVTVLACDTTCREAPGGLSSAGPEAARAVSEFFASVTPEGGSDVAAAVRRGRDALRGAPKGAARVVYVGDGTPTIGAVAPAFLRREIEAAVPRDAGTVTAVAIGADADVATLSMLAEAGGGVLVPYVPGQTLTDATYALLGATYGTTLCDVRVELPDGLRDLAPQRIGTLRAGGEALLVARMDAPSISGTLTIHGTISGAPFEQRYPLEIDATTSKGNAFVPRLWAAGEIAELEQRPDAASRSQAIELSSRFHVASRYTSLLVLESAAMMHAFGLARDERA